MNKKIIVFEVIFILVAFSYYIIFKMIPEYKDTIGSSDHLFNYDKYVDMYEFLYDDGCNFSIVLDDNRKVYHIMFFDKNSISLYNQRIEGNSLENVLNIIIDTFGKDNLKLYYYNGVYLDTIKGIMGNDLLFNKLSIKDKALSLGINNNSDEVMLQDMDYYSKEIIRKYKNNINKSLSNDFVTYSDNVYKKIEEFISTNNIVNLERDNTALLIHMIPADKSLLYYPSVNSWYYVSDGKIYSYIEFVDDGKKYGYCYRGSIDLRSEGECS